MPRLLLTAALLCIAGTCQAAPPAYKVTQTVALGLPDKWDYVSFDAASHRVLIAHGTHTDVVDGHTGAVLGKLEGLQGAHGQAVAAGGAIFADSGKSGTFSAFDPATMKLLRTGPAGVDADGVILEPSHNLVVVLDGDAEAATLLDATGKRDPVTVKLGGSPEFAAADGAGAIFVNIASTSEIVRVDAGTGRVAARFAVAACDSPHGLAMDPKTRRLFTTCLNAKMLVLDADSGKILQTLPIGHGSDAAAFDPVRKLVFSSNGEGTLSVLHESDDGVVTSLGEVKTAPGARTLAVDPQNGRVFLVTADVAGSQPAGHGGLVPHYAFKPGSVKLLFLDPA